MSKQEILDLLLKAYSAGISQGLLIANEEAENRLLFDAFNNCLASQKLPLNHTPMSFEPKSEKWFDCTKKEAEKFYELVAKYCSKEKQECLF
jgi:hypothetical protein